MTRRRNNATKHKSIREDKAPVPRSTDHSQVLSALKRWTPELLILLIAALAMRHELVTHKDYADSAEILSILKNAYIFSVCVTFRVNLWPFLRRSVMRKQKRRLRTLILAKAKLLACVLLANCAGTSMIQPLLNQFPHYFSVCSRTVPLFLISEVCIDILRIPPNIVLVITGLLTAWYKSISTAKLVREWHAQNDANIAHLLLLSTANLFAGGYILKFLLHWFSSSKYVTLNRKMCNFMVNTLCKGGIAASIAFFANTLHDFDHHREKSYFFFLVLIIFLLVKYWKSSLDQFLAIPKNH